MQKPQISAMCPHLKFTVIRVRPSTGKDDKSTELEESVFESIEFVMKVIGKQVVFEEKPYLSAGLNRIEFCSDLSYHGGGCLKMITENLQSYHRYEDLINEVYNPKIYLYLFLYKIQKLNA